MASPPTCSSAVEAEPSKSSRRGRPVLASEGAVPLTVFAPGRLGGGRRLPGRRCEDGVVVSGSRRWFAVHAPARRVVASAVRRRARPDGSREVIESARRSESPGAGIDSLGVASTPSARLFVWRLTRIRASRCTTTRHLCACCEVVRGRRLNSQSIVVVIAARAADGSRESKQQRSRSASSLRATRRVVFDATTASPSPAWRCPWPIALEVSLFSCHCFSKDAQFAAQDGITGFVLTVRGLDIGNHDHQEAEEKVFGEEARSR